MTFGTPRPIVATCFPLLTCECALSEPTFPFVSRKIVGYFRKTSAERACGLSDKGSETKFNEVN